MDELDKGLEIGADEKTANEALGRCFEVIASWGLKMPAVTALVLDFGLGDFYRTGLIEFWIANESQAGYCGKFLFVFDGQQCPMHHHINKHETFFVVAGSVKMEYKDETKVMGAGEVLSVDKSNPHSFTGAGDALLLELSSPCVIEDNFFKDRKIPIVGNYVG
jgi:mannose-6-phosphate isomerase-like protein (cupin superfamily)